MSDVMSLEVKSGQAMLPDVQFAYNLGCEQGIQFGLDMIQQPLRIAGGKVESMEQFLPHPVRRRARIEFRDRESFCSYVTEFVEAGTQVFADLEKQVVEVVFDYHDVHPGWGEHRATLTYPLSSAWKAWSEARGWISQLAFSELLDDRQGDIRSDVSGQADVGEMIRSLEITHTQKWGSAVQGGGQIALTAESKQDVNGPGRVVLPSALHLGMRIFESTPVREIKARVSYRVHDGAVSFRVALVNADEMVRREFRSECTEIEKSITGSLDLGDYVRESFPVRYGVVRSMGL